MDLRKRAVQCSDCSSMTRWCSNWSQQHSFCWLGRRSIPCRRAARFESLALSSSRDHLGDHLLTCVHTAHDLHIVSGTNPDVDIMLVSESIRAGDHHFFTAFICGEWSATGTTMASGICPASIEIWTVVPGFKRSSGIRSFHPHLDGCRIRVDSRTDHRHFAGQFATGAGNRRRPSDMDRCRLVHRHIRTRGNPRDIDHRDQRRAARSPFLRYSTAGLKRYR